MPRVSGSTHTHDAVASARTSGTESPPARPARSTAACTTTGARSCAARARLYVVPIAAPRTSVGKSSASSAPKPAVQPEPKPSMSIVAQKSAGCAESVCQANASGASAHAVSSEYSENAGRRPTAVGHDAEREHAHELPALRGEHPRERLADALVHLLDEEARQPRVAGPVRAELEDAEHPRARPGAARRRAGEHRARSAPVAARGLVRAGAPSGARRARGAPWRSIR